MEGSDAIPGIAMLLRATGAVIALLVVAWGLGGVGFKEPQTTKQIEKVIVTHFRSCDHNPEVVRNSFFNSFGRLGNPEEASAGLPAPSGAQVCNR